MRRGFLRGPRAIFCLFVAVLGAIGVSYLWDYLWQGQRRVLVAEQVSVNPLAQLEAHQLSTPGEAPERILDPPTLTVQQAEEKGITDAEPVVGLTVNGEAMAFRVSAVSGPAAHDPRFTNLGKSHVAFVYCDLIHCARAFVSAKSLPIEVQGLTSTLKGKQGMSILFGEQAYRLDAKNLPLQRYKATETKTVFTTWGDWRRAHPGTRIYIGEDQIDGLDG